MASYRLPDHASSVSSPPRRAHRSLQTPHHDPYDSLGFPDTAAQPRQELSYPNLYLASIAQVSTHDGRRDSMDALREIVLAAGNDSAGPPSATNYGLIFMLLIGLLFSVMDTTIVSTALVTITAELGDFRDGYWIVLSYVLAYIGFCLAIARLSDHFGRRPMLLFSWAIFIAFSIACGCAQTISELIIFRALQGVGGSGLYSLSQIVIAETAAPGDTARVSTLIGMTLAVSFVVGPICGGVLSQFYWPMIFFINIPAGLVSCVGIWSLWPEGYGGRRLAYLKLCFVDWMGMMLLGGSCTIMIYALQEAGVMTFPFSGDGFRGLIIMGVVLWAAFWAWEFVFNWQFKDVHVLFPPRLWRNREYIAALVTILISGFGYVALVVTLPERFQIVNGDAPAVAGAHLLPVLGATAVGSVIGGAASRDKDATHWTLMAASSLQVLGLGLLTTFRAWDTSVKPEYAFQAVFGLGAGLSFSAATVLTKLRVSAGDHAAAQAAMAQARVFGGAFGLVMCTAIYNQHLEAVAPWIQTDDLDKLRHAPLAALGLPPNEVRLVKSAYAGAFAAEVRIMLYVAAAGVLSSLFTMACLPGPLASAAGAVGRLCARRGARDRGSKRLPSRGGSDTEMDDFGGRRPVPGPSADRAELGLAL